MALTIEQIAALVGGILAGKGGAEISRAAGLDTAAAGDVSFLERAELTAAARNSKASCLFVPEEFDAEISSAVIKVKNPKLAFALAAAALQPFKRRAGFHESAVIAGTSDVRAAFVGAFVVVGENTVVGEGTHILDGSKIGSRVSIGANTVIHANCVIYDNVSIGDNCRLHAGAIIGADGFGYVRDGENGYVKFPQIGTVRIEDDVEIGANSCVDRGALGETFIGRGTKIDNLVQIAHNVRIGERVIIAAQTGISGSTVVEDDCVIGGQVGMGDHARVLSGAVIGSQAGVLPGKIVRAGVWWGTPVQPLAEYKRQNARVKGLERLRQELREIKKQISGISEKIKDKSSD